MWKKTSQKREKDHMVEKVKMAVKSKKDAYKRWLQVKSAEVKDEYLKAKRAAGHAVKNAKK